MANSVSIRSHYQSDVPQGLAKDKAAFGGLNSAANTHLGAVATGFGKVEKAAGSFGGALGHAKSQIAGVAGSVGLLGGALGAAGLVGALGASVNSSRDFASAMELIKTQAGGTQAEVDNMTQAILKLAPAVGSTPEQLAAGLYHIESAGLSGAKALDVLTTSAKLAKVGQADLEATTNALIAAVNSGVKGITDTTQAAGVLNSVIGSGNMRMEDLNAALGTGILSSAKIFGVSIQSVGGALAAMTNQGIPAIDAANEIRSAMRLMAAPTSAAAKELKGIGLSTSALALDMRGPQGILGAVIDLKAHMDKAGLSAVQQGQLLTAAFGGKQSQGILTMVTGLDKLQTATDKVAAGAGQFGAAWASTEETAQAKFDRFKAAMSTVMIDLGNAVLPIFTDLATAGADFIEKDGSQIEKFFKDGASFAREMGGAINATVVPAFGAIAKAWGAIPGPLKELLIGGFVAQKATKWLTGASLLGGSKSLLSSVLGLGAGKLPGPLGTVAGAAAGATPVNVMNWPAGFGTGLPGAGGGAGAAEAVGGLLAPGLAPLAAMIGGTVAMYAIPAILAANNTPAKAVSTSTGTFAQTGTTSVDFFQGLSPALAQAIHNSASTPSRDMDKALGVQPYAALGATTAPAIGRDMDKGLSKGYTKSSGIDTSTLAGVMAASQKITARKTEQLLEVLHADFQKQMGILGKSKDPKEIAAAAAKVAADIVKGVGSVGTTQGTLDTLKSQRDAASKAGDKALVSALDHAIAQVASKLDSRKWIDAQLKSADRIVKSQETTKAKIADLTKIQNTLLHDGDKVAAAHISKEIDTLKPHIDDIKKNIKVQIDIENAAHPGAGVGVHVKGPTGGQRAFASGTDYVPHDMVALIHRGERIIPAAQNRPNYGAPSLTFAPTINLPASSVLTPGLVRELAQQLGPAFTMWMQRQGILPRVGSPQRG